MRINTVLCVATSLCVWNFPQWLENNGVNEIDDKCIVDDILNSNSTDTVVSGVSTKLSNEQALLNAQTRSIADYYSFALKQSSVKCSSCIRIEIQGVGIPVYSHLCIHKQTNKWVVTEMVEVPEKLTGTPEQFHPPVHSVVTFEKHILNMQWETMMDMNTIRKNARVSSYMGMLRFLSLFKFGDSTWNSYQSVTQT